MTIKKENLILGIDNLLRNCANLKYGERLLIIWEDPKLGWYDEEISVAVADAVRKMDIEPTMLKVGAPGNEVDTSLDDAIAQHDCTIYLARVGDQHRFGILVEGVRTVMSYARDVEAMASVYGRSSHHAFVQVKEAVDEILFCAKEIKISCPKGTQISGSVPPGTDYLHSDVSVLRFPLGVPTPMKAEYFSGRVAVSHFLTPTGSKSYQPDHITLEGVSFAEVESGRIKKFTGESEQVAAIDLHYKHVSEKFEIDRDIVHSWHAGIHPGSNYPGKAAENPDLWSNSVFTNPRVLHFHTCGDYAPAEICWMIFDYTVTVDGKNLWESGQLMLSNFPVTRAILGRWPELVPVFDNPAQQLGIRV